jgi:hypothetical protein
MLPTSGSKKDARFEAGKTWNQKAGTAAARTMSGDTTTVRE